MFRRAATSTARRAEGPGGELGTGLGQTTSSGTVGLIAPTLDITHTGQEESSTGSDRLPDDPGDRGAGGDELPLPGQRALCMAENATHNMHNILTLRGALVRDPRSGRAT